MWGSHRRKMVDPELSWGRRLWNNGRMPFRRYLAITVAIAKLSLLPGLQVR